MKKVKKVASLATVVLMCMSLFVGCGPEQGTVDTSEGEIPTVAASFEKIYEDHTEKQLAPYDPSAPEKNGLVSYSIQTAVGNKNYMRITLETNVDLVGYVSYFNTADPSQANGERFYIEAGSTVFTTFLDAFRNGAFAPYEKTIDKITLQSVDHTREGKVKLKTVDFSDRTYDPNMTLYIDDGKTKLGTSLGFGGAITYIARINSGVVEYIDSEGNMCIGRPSDLDSVDIVSEECNLVNIYDLGREIQQSFYWGLTEENGYLPTSEQKYPGALHYNPIQCGSAGSVGPQIVDYYCTEQEIYVKSYGQDWFVVNQVDPTYFETWFSFDENGALIVRNRITNFGQFVDTEKLPICSQETPAFYSVYPLDYFYSETIEGEIFDNTLCAVNGGSCKTKLSDEVEGRYHYRLQQDQLTNSWAAFVTEEKFGLGIYNPYAEHILAYSGIHNRSYMYSMNQQTHPDFYVDDYSSYIPSCYAYSYGYMATVIATKMTDFVPLEYSYALFAGNVSEMGTAFEELYTGGKLVADKIAWPSENS